MTALVRILRLLTLTIWVGGLVFFAFVVAPVAFSVLPTAHMAGTVVAGTLKVLNILGLICGLLAVLAVMILWTHARGAANLRTIRLLAVQLSMLVIMLAATAWVHFGIVPAMERDRIAAGGNVDAAPPDNPARLDFERLHPISEKVEGAALLLGVATIILVGLERPA